MNDPSALYWANESKLAADMLRRVAGVNEGTKVHATPAQYRRAAELLIEPLRVVTGRGYVPRGAEVAGALADYKASGEYSLGAYVSVEVWVPATAAKSLSDTGHRLNEEEESET